MPFVRTEDLRIGMMVCDDVYSKAGQLIVRKDSLLSRQMLSHLKFYSIEQVNIYDGEMAMEIREAYEKRNGAQTTQLERILKSEEYKVFKKEYTDFESQISILRDRHRENPLDKIQPKVNIAELQQLIEEASAVQVMDCIYEYVTKLTQATRNHPMIALGVSPRGALAVCRMAKAYAYLHGRSFVVPEDVVAVFADTCAHRLVLATKARMMEEKPETIIRSILESVKMPVIKK